jgi:hypothetical protein
VAGFSCKVPSGTVRSRDDEIPATGIRVGSQRHPVELERVVQIENVTPGPNLRGDPGAGAGHGRSRDGSDRFRTDSGAALGGNLFVL